MDKKFFFSMTFCLAVALLIYFSLVAPRYSRHSRVLTLSNNKIALEFSSRTFNLLRIKDVSTGRSYEFANSSLWKITFLDVRRARSGQLGRDLFRYMLSDDPSLDR